jgi:hypothetical protein
MIWIVILVLVFVCIVSAIIFSHHTMKIKWEEATNIDVRLVREAAEHSVRASNTENIVLALTEATNAHRTIEIFVRRYGTKRSSELSGIDIGEVLETMGRQRDHIMQDLTTSHPELLPKGELKHYAGFVKERDSSRNLGVTHFDVEEEEAKI